MLFKILKSIFYFANFLSLDLLLLYLPIFELLKLKVDFLYFLPTLFPFFNNSKSF